MRQLKALGRNLDHFLHVLSQQSGLGRVLPPRHGSFGDVGQVGWNENSSRFHLYTPTCPQDDRTRAPMALPNSPTFGSNIGHGFS